MGGGISIYVGDKCKSAILNDISFVSDVIKICSVNLLLVMFLNNFCKFLENKGQCQCETSNSLFIDGDDDEVPSTSVETISAFVRTCARISSQLSFSQLWVSSLLRFPSLRNFSSGEKFLSEL